MPINPFYLLLLLLCICTTLNLASPTGALVQDAILPMLLGAASASFIQYFSNGPHKRYSLWLVVLFALNCLWLPSLVLYWPVMVFVAPSPLGALALVVTLALHSALLGPHAVILSLLLSVTAWYLASFLSASKEAKRNLLVTTDNAREMERTLKRHYQELMDKQDSDLRIATLNERQRIAREMHDHAGHLLSRALLQLGAIMATQGHEETLSPLKETLSQAMSSLRTSVHNLHDDAIDLDLQLRQLTSDFALCPINLNLNFSKDPSTKLKLAIIAIYKEALSNMMHHSNASRADVTFIEHPDFYQFVISDNGTTAQGKTFSTISLNHQGMGLANISRRIEALSGHMIIKTSPGFTLFMTIPKAPPALKKETP